MRFLGRKVYLGAMVVLATAMQQGLSPARLLHLQELLGVSRRTLKRWRVFWAEFFGKSPFWQSARGRLARPIEGDRLPFGLLEVMGWREMMQRVALFRLLRFITPITTRPHLRSQAI